MIILHFRSNQSINQSINLSINQSHRTSWRHDWPRGLGALNSSPLSGLFTSVSVSSSTRFYRFTSATGRIGVYTALKYDKKPIRYLILHFEIGLAQRRSITDFVAATTVLVCEQKPYRILPIFNI